jgi:hypothetical protein
MPENHPKILRVPLCGAAILAAAGFQPALAESEASCVATVENRAEVGRTPWSAAGPLASLPRFRREHRKRRVFIAFGGPQGHGDKQDRLPHNPRRAG